ncbi:MAG TPA: hypothetical protein VFZ65_09260 [Planctomycetota bacterium]|nr:hypothetical protein [Planctomycetota bacterium]
MPVSPTAARLGTACVLLAVLVPAAAAQQRAPCTGFVRAPDGSALAGANVVCARRPDSGEPDRREVTTGADGSFDVELAIGGIYFIWAIGPADDAGRRAVVLPVDEAAAGRTLALDATLLLAPVRLDVRGTAAWLADGVGGGPLALRIAVADRIALGPDLPIPGDGPVPLPALPVDRFDVGLVNGRGEVVSLLSIDTTIEAVAAFPAARAVDVAVTDADGAAIAGAKVLRLDVPDLPPARARAETTRWASLAAITDAHGRARCLVPTGSRMLFAAAHDGRKPAISGWFEGRRFENGKLVAKDDPDQALGFVLEPGQAAIVRVLGTDEHDRPDVRFFDYQLLRLGRHSTAVLRQYPGAAGPDGRYSCDAMATTATQTALVQVARAQPTPHLTYATTAPAAPGKPMFDVDLRTLRTFPVEVVDGDGAEVPGARVAAQALGSGTLAPLCELVTDLRGHAELRLADEGYSLHATTPTAYGVALAPTGRKGPLRIVVQPLATIRVRVVDRKQRPVPGARVEMRARVTGVGAQPTEASERTLFAAGERNCARFACRRTGADGELTVRYVAAEANARFELVATRGAGTSGPVPMQPDDGVQVLTLR